MSAQETAQVDKADAAPPPEVPLNPVFFTAEGDLTDKFYETLRTVFLKYAKTPAATGAAIDGEATLDDEAKARKAGMGREQMNAFSKATNGAEIADEQWDEVIMYLDTNEATELTFKGFVGLYTLQTENDEAETVKDLKQWGYDPATLDAVVAASKQEESGEAKA
ncbi:hypothetical protein JCM3775_005738 [Rhodotorula graminis]